MHQEIILLVFKIKEIIALLLWVNIVKFPLNKIIVLPLTDLIAITLLKDGISQRIKLMFLMGHLTLFRWVLIATLMME